MALTTITWADKVDAAGAPTGKVNGSDMNQVKTAVNQHASTLNYLLSLTPEEIVILKQLVLTMTTP